MRPTQPCSQPSRPRKPTSRPTPGHKRIRPLTKNAIAAGIDRGTRAFAGNAGSLPFAATPTAVPVLTRSGQTFTATISYQTSSTNNFGQIFGQKMTTIGGSTGARADVPSYIDFYLLIDVSGSMGLPATTDGQSALIAHTPSSCQFVCHFPGNDGSVPNSTGWNLRRQQQHPAAIWCRKHGRL